MICCFQLFSFFRHFHDYEHDIHTWGNKRKANSSTCNVNGVNCRLLHAYLDVIVFSSGAGYHVFLFPRTLVRSQQYFREDVNK